MPEAYEQVYAVVRRIPKGKILTYGLVSHMVNERLSAQGVGWALQALASTREAPPGHAPAQPLRVSRLRASLSSPLIPARGTRPPAGRSRAVSSKGVYTTCDRGTQGRRDKKTPVPWHRVINSQGGISTHKNPNIPLGLQRALLEKEGVVFDDQEKIDLSKYLWKEGPANLHAG